MDFTPFPKIARLSRDIVITEKLDGTNAQVTIVDLSAPGWVEGELTNAIAVVNGHAIHAGSRSRWLTPGKTTDNYGFAMWVNDNAEDLVNLGPGQHFGEWWGKGIQRGYGLTEKRFSLFNVHRWMPGNIRAENGQQYAPGCCHVVPVLYRGPLITNAINTLMVALKTEGSVAAHGFMNPEGIIVYHSGANVLFKKTFESDAAGKERTLAA